MADRYISCEWLLKELSEYKASKRGTPRSAIPTRFCGCCKWWKTV